MAPASYTTTTATAEEKRPVVFVSEEEIPPWSRGRRRGMVLSRPVRRLLEAAPVEAAPSPAPGFSSKMSLTEVQLIHERLRQLYAEAMAEWNGGFGGESWAWMAFLDYIASEEPRMADFLEDTRATVVRDFLMNVVQKLGRGRLGAGERVQRRAGGVLKAFFLAPAEWE
jgi:hypothetical protein